MDELIDVGQRAINLLNPRFGRIKNRRGRWPQPTKVICREIDISIVGRKIEIKYINKNAPLTVADHRAFKTLVKGISTAKVLPTTRSITNSTASSAHPPVSPMSLNNSELAYVVFLLNKDKDWQFAKEFDPISVAVNIAADEVYFDARRVHPSDGIIGKGEEKDGCNVAYMIAHGTKSLEMDENQPSKYWHPFNLHVDALGLDTSNPPNIIHRIPLIIDPDVRHPGGSDD